jgi:hypothetical protein
VKRKCIWCGQDAGGINGLVKVEDICVALFVKRAQWELVGPREAAVASAILTSVRATAIRAGVNVDWKNVERRAKDDKDPITAEAVKP